MKAGSTNQQNPVSPIEKGCYPVGEAERMSYGDLQASEGNDHIQKLEEEVRERGKRIKRINEDLELVQEAMEEAMKMSSK